MSDDHQIPWGLPGLTDPVERASAHNLDLQRDPVRLRPPGEWSTDGIPDDQRSPERTAELK